VVSGHDVERFIVGIDLSGPANAANTAVVWFREEHGTLQFAGDVSGASDADIASVVAKLGTPVVGLDAPLSYNSGGGFRPADKSLQREVIQAGMKPGSVMAPTFNRMAYLTLRGVVVARLLETAGSPRNHIVEVHPGAAFALRGAPMVDVLALGQDHASRSSLLKWLRTVGVRGTPDTIADTSHSTAACGAALAAWSWRDGTPKWVWKASPPHHPYDFAC
jgi:predicted nuclease with RNAse H fold